MPGLLERLRGPDPNRREPGPQRLVKRSPIGSVLLAILIGAVFLAATLAVAQDNWKHLLPGELRELKLLDTNNALTLLIALLTLVAMRQQYLATLKPYLTYSSHRVAAGETGKADDGWRVEIYNVGTGVATIQETRFRLVDGGGESARLGHDQVSERLQALGWKEGTGYRLPRFSQGFVLGPENKVTAFETDFASLQKLRALDLEVTFASRAGEQYVKDVFLVPRPSTPVASTANPPPERPAQGGEATAAPAEQGEERA